jgi:hypothetical protein
MAIGGKFYLSNQAAQAKRFNFGADMNRQAVQQNISTANAYATSLFSINSAAGEEFVSLVFQQAVGRIEAQVQAQNEELQNAASAFNNLNELFA